VQRVVALLGEELVGAHRHHRVVVFDRELDVVEVVLGEQTRLPQRRLHQRLRGGLAVLFQQPGVERARVDPDPDRGTGVLRSLRDLSHPVVEALDVARVHPHPRTARVEGGEDVLRLEVNVGDHRQLGLAGDRGQRVGIVRARTGHPHDVATGRGELGDLLQRRVDVGGERGGHGLHGHRVVTSHAYLADLQLTGGPPSG
jgi:hypothetical protein